MHSARLYLTPAEVLDLITRLDDLAQLEPETTIPRIRTKLLKAAGLNSLIGDTEQEHEG